MDLSRTKSFLKYALSVAGLEDPGNQELGPIHLIKYVYLGDLAYADLILERFKWRFKA